jgi:hypothetical protein
MPALLTATDCRDFLTSSNEKARKNRIAGYISVFAVTAAIGSAFTAGHLEKPQVTKRFCP